MFSYSLRAKARSDLQNIANYIVQDNPDASKKLLLAAYETFNLIANNPEIFPYFLGSTGKTMGLRQGNIRKYPSYLVFYRVTEKKSIEIIRILHSSRDIPPILSS